MEEITEGVNNINIGVEPNKKNRIQRYMQQYNEVELSALGMAISTVVTVAEILKNNGLVVETMLGKTEDFDELMVAAAEEKEFGVAEEQS